MIKKLISYAIVFVFIFSVIGVYASEINQPTAKPFEKTKDRASRAMNNIFYGPVEIPANLDQTKTKGTEMDRCSKKTRSGVERGIARIVGGVWQLATFWYSDPGCVTSSAAAGGASASTSSTSSAATK